MTKISYKKRTGKDLFDYMASSIVEPKTAMDSIFQKFVLIDNKSVTLRDLVNINDEAYLIISNSIFGMNIQDDIVYEDNEGVHWKNIIIKKKQIKRDFITQMQTSKGNSTHIEILKKVITSLFDVDIKFINKESYELAAYLVGKSNNFLNEITTNREQFELANIWREDTKKTTGGELGSVVRESN